LQDRSLHHKFSHKIDTHTHTHTHTHTQISHKIKKKNDWKHKEMIKYFFYIEDSLGFFRTSEGDSCKISPQDSLGEFLLKV